jgi:hypothetical protein
MKTGYWIVLIMVAWLLSFAGGYKASSATGIQPGYFEAAEAGGYGGGETAIEGITTEVQDYYKDLYKEE